MELPLRPGAAAEQIVEQVELGRAVELSGIVAELLGQRRRHPLRRQPLAAAKVDERPVHSAQGGADLVVVDQLGREARTSGSSAL